MHSKHISVKLVHFFHISVFGVCPENQLNNFKTVKRSHLSTTQWVGQGNEIDQKKSSKNVLRPNNTKRRTKWEISPPPLIIRGIRRMSWPCTRGLWRTLVTRGRGCQPFSSSIVSARIAMQVHCNTLHCCDHHWRLPAIHWWEQYWPHQLPSGTGVWGLSRQREGGNEKPIRTSDLDSPPFLG